MRKTIAFVIAVGTLAAAAVFFQQKHTAVPVQFHTVSSSATTTVLIGNVLYSVAIADTPASRELGLSGRTSLKSHEGMLFIFPEDGQYAFWMKDMRFSIDIVWISSAGEVLYIEKDVSPATYPHAFKPLMRARYVLELPANSSKEYTISPGNMMSFK